MGGMLWRKTLTGLDYRDGGEPVYLEGAIISYTGSFHDKGLIWDNEIGEETRHLGAGLKASVGSL